MYPTYYGGYGDFLANNIYCVLLIPVLLLSLWAQAQVSGNFRRYSGVTNRRRLTGAQAAEAVLRAHGVYDVPIRTCRGFICSPPPCSCRKTSARKRSRPCCVRPVSALTMC